MNSTAEASTGAVDGQCNDSYLDLHGARLRYRDEGRGAAVLLVHGWTLDLDVWESQVEALRRAFRLIRFDRRGFGRSTGEPSMEHDVLDLGAIIEHFELARIALVGMSQGSRAVLAYGCAHPTQVSCIVLDGPPEFDGSKPGANLSLAPLRELVRTHGLAAFRQQWMQHPLMQLRTRDAGARERLQRIVDRYPGRDLAAGTAYASPPDLWAGLESLAVPTLVMTGEHDLPDRVRAADALAEWLPAGTRAEIAGSGHLASFDNPDSYNRQLAAFLAAHANTAS